MQPLEKVTKKESIKHPFRNIELTYETGKSKLTPQDEELLAGYVRLHDFELELKNTANELYQESKTANKTIEVLSEQLKKVQASFDTCCTLADKLSQTSYLVEETSLEKLELQRQQTELQLYDYNEKLLNLYKGLKELQKKINEYYKVDEETVDDLYNEFTTLSMKHLENGENNSIDSVAFDRQFDDFRDYRTIIESQRQGLTDLCEEAITNYTNLNLETSALYNCWNEFIKRNELLKTLHDLHSQATGFAQN